MNRLLAVLIWLLSTPTIVFSSLENSSDKNFEEFIQTSCQKINDIDTRAGHSVLLQTLWDILKDQSFQEAINAFEDVISRAALCAGSLKDMLSIDKPRMPKREGYSTDTYEIVGELIRLSRDWEEEGFPTKIYWDATIISKEARDGIALLVSTLFKKIHEIQNWLLELSSRFGAADINSNPVTRPRTKSKSCSDLTSLINR